MRGKKAFLVTLVVTSLSSLLFFSSMGKAETQVGPRSYLSKTGSTLELLIAMAEEETQRGFAVRGAQPRVMDTLGEIVAKIAQTQSLNVSIRFDHELGVSEIADLEREGLRFVRLNGEVVHSGKIYGVRLPISSVDTLTGRTDILRIESTWKPAVHLPLDVSVPEINADDMWQLLDGGGDNITGNGITVADFDTGIDVFHPAFWYADGGSYAWIDTDNDNVFDPGFDAVDLDDDGVADADETLGFFDAQGPAGNNDGVFQADMDWLYNDSNDSGQRDFGTASGFAETDPTFGEMIFVADDTNHNNVLDVGEGLIALGTSKVSRTMNGGTERIRGTDLILSDDDTNGHGTSVCGVISGGTIGRRKYVGVAPNAELLVSHGTDYTVYIPWARTNGADVMLYEFGAWVQEFMDGSSNLEQMIDTEAAGGIVQVVPAGNLGHKDKHAQDDVAAGGNTGFTFNVPSTDNPGTPADEDIDRVFITALWRTTGNDLDFTITTPTPSVVNLPASPGDTSWHSVTSGDGHTIYYRREDSSRGTAKYDITIEGTGIKVVLGGWTVQVDNSGGSNEQTDMYIADNRTAWSGGALWTAFQANQNTIDWPATADSAITVASYSTRGWSGVAAGDLSTFSPEGPRIDGQDIMDIAAPGNFDIGSALSKDATGGSLGSYRWFSGTSAAGPHVAGASALLLQWDPTLNHGQVKTLLQQNARTDAFTGGTPNAEWGYGKLDVLAAVNQPPVCSANGPYTAACQGTTTEVTLDGSGSSDPNAGDILTYLWTTNCAGGSFDDSSSQNPVLSVDSSPGCFECNVHLTVTDLAGASDSCSSNVTIYDDEPPVLSCPPDITIECDESSDPATTGPGTATDTCDSNPSLSYSDMETPGACPQEKTITRTWTAKDACLNESSCVQIIEVVDTTAPVIACNAPATITPPDAPISFKASAIDNCDAAPVVEIITYDCFFYTKKGKRIDKTESCVVEVEGDTITILDSGGVGDHITWTVLATDSCGNVAEQLCDVVVINPRREL